MDLYGIFGKPAGWRHSEGKIPFEQDHMATVMPWKSFTKNRLSII